MGAKSLQIPELRVTSPSVRSLDRLPPLIAVVQDPFALGRTLKVPKTGRSETRHVPQ